MAKADLKKKNQFVMPATAEEKRKHLKVLLHISPRLTEAVQL